MGRTLRPMLLNLLTASAPRSLRALLPGAVMAVVIARRPASQISIGSKRSSSSTASQGWSSLIAPTRWLRRRAEGGSARVLI